MNCSQCGNEYGLSEELAEKQHELEHWRFKSHFWHEQSDMRERYLKDSERKLAERNAEIRSLILGSDSDISGLAKEVGNNARERFELYGQVAALKAVLAHLYTFPGVQDLLAPKGSLGSIKDMVEEVLSYSYGKEWIEVLERAQKNLEKIKFMSHLQSFCEHPEGKCPWKLAEEIHLEIRKLLGK